MDVFIKESLFRLQVDMHLTGLIVRSILTRAMFPVKCHTSWPREFLQSGGSGPRKVASGGFCFHLSVWFFHKPSSLHARAGDRFVVKNTPRDETFWVHFLPENGRAINMMPWLSIG